MAKSFMKPWMNSLKGKIQLATAALALFVVAFGGISYFLSFLLTNSFYAFFLPFLFLSATVLFFGRWLSKEIASPVEKVSLLAKSYERGVSTSVPKTSGSTETDELAQIIARLSAKVQKLVASLDEVANGNLDVVFSQDLENDRISQVFQKLLLKVSESIYAKQNLDKLQNALLRLSDEILAVKNGNLSAKLSTDAPEAEEISEVLNLLTEQLNEIVVQIRINGSQTQILTGAIQKTLHATVERDERRVQEMNQAAVTLRHVPDVVQQISEELSQSSVIGNQSIEKARKGTSAARENLNAVGSLRRQIQQAIKNIERFSERSREINRVSKMVEDLAQRAGLVALNASIQANELGESGRGFVIVSEEVDRLAKRAEKTNKHISALNKTIQIEIGDIENSLLAAVGEIADLSRFAIETGSALDESEKYVAGVLNLQNKVAAFSRERSAETEKAFQVFVSGISDTETSLSGLKEATHGFEKISAAVAELQSLAVDFKVQLPVEPEIAAETAYQTYELPEAEISA